MIRIEGTGLTAIVNPRRGAKITSLTDTTGTEWLAQGDGHEVAADAGFTDAEMSGWDECAPTIIACHVNGYDLPDHGDLWSAEFDIDTDTVTTTGTSMPYRFTRRITPTATGLRLDYTARTRENALPFLWAAHPQFTAPPGTRVELPVTIDSVIDVLDDTTPHLPWTPALSTIDTVPAGGCRKLYTPPERQTDHAHLIRPDNSALTMRWSSACPYLGIWYDNGAYNTRPVIALEPSTAHYDSLAFATRLGRAATLDPHAPLTWWVELEARPAGALASRHG